jgi:hypothetical protein
MKTKRRFALMLAFVLIGAFVSGPNTALNGRMLAQKNSRPVGITDRIPAGPPVKVNLPNGGHKEVYKNKSGQTFQEDEYNGLGVKVREKHIVALYPNGKEAEVGIVSYGAAGIVKTEDFTYDKDGKIASTTTYKDYDQNGQAQTKILIESGDTYNYEWNPKTKKYDDTENRPKRESVGPVEQPELPAHEVFPPKDQPAKPKTSTPPAEPDAKPSPKVDEASLPSMPPTALPGYNIATNTNSGLYTISFTTPQGQVNVNFTDDLAAGDTISGTVEEEPAGRTVSERAQNQAELNGYVIELEKQQTRVRDKYITRNIPVALTAAERIIRILRDGREVARAEVPISSEAKPTPTEFTLPTGGQQGKPIEIKGPCDGLFRNSDYVKIGETTVPVLAESPRKKVVRDTSEVIGPTRIECAENGKVTECPFRNLGIRVSADKLNLLKGETTTLHVAVLGLKGINQEVPLDLVNHSPATIAMSGGNEQHMIIRAGDVKADGTYPTDRTLTGVKGGSFGITATVRWSNLCTDGQPTSAEPTDKGDSTVSRDLPKGYTLCGSGCGQHVSKEEGGTIYVYCVTKSDCKDRGPDCGCHLFGASSQKGDEKDPWEHKADPFPNKWQKEKNTEYRCMCVKKD